MGQPRHLFSVFLIQLYNFYNRLMWKMSIEYSTQGFELMTFWLWVSSFDHTPRLQPNILGIVKSKCTNVMHHCRHSYKLKLPFIVQPTRYWNRYHIPGLFLFIFGLLKHQYIFTADKYEKSIIQYPVLGFELLTSRTRGPP